MAIYKVVICGDGGVGKSTLVRNLVGESPPKRLTIGADFYTYKYRGSRFVIVDVGGESRFRFIIPLIARGARGVVYVFDLTRPATLFSLISWSRVIREVADPRVVTILVGNKADLYKNVSEEAIEEVRKELGIEKYLEGCAFDLEHVRNIFETIFNAVILRTSRD